MNWCVLLRTSARSGSFTLRISLKLSVGADYTDGLHSLLDHCMHKLDCFNFSVKPLNK